MWHKRYCDCNKNNGDKSDMPHSANLDIKYITANNLADCYSTNCHCLVLPRETLYFLGIWKGINYIDLFNNSDDKEIW